MATLVDDKVTPLSVAEVLEAFRGAYLMVFGEHIKKAALAVIVAKSALETGRWKSIHCYNFGNIKSGKSWTGDYCMFRCNEIINGKVQWFDPPHPQTWFRAYPSAYDGAADYLRFVGASKRYAKAWQCALAGDPDGFVTELKRAGYFTADEAPYKKAVLSLFKEFSKVIEQSAFPDQERPTRPDSVGAMQAEPDWDGLLELVDPALRARVIEQQFDITGIVHAEAIDELTKEDGDE